MYTVTTRQEVPCQRTLPVDGAHPFAQRERVAVRKDEGEGRERRPNILGSHIQVCLRRHVGERFANPESFPAVELKVGHELHVRIQAPGRVLCRTDWRDLAVRLLRVISQEPLDLQIRLDILGSHKL